MQHINKLLLPFALAFSLGLQAQSQLNIVPMPASVELPAKAGTQAISRNTPLVLAGSGLEKSAAFLNSYLQQAYGF